MLAKTCIFAIIRVAEQGCPFAVGTLLMQSVKVTFGPRQFISACIKQVKMIESLVYLREIWIVMNESQQCFLTQIKVVQPVFEDDSAVEKPVSKQLITGFQLFRSHWYLFQIVFSSVRISLRIIRLLQGIFNQFGLFCDTV